MTEQYVIDACNKVAGMASAMVSLHKTPLYMYMGYDGCSVLVDRPAGRPHAVVLPDDPVDVIRKRLLMLAKWH